MSAKAGLDINKVIREGTRRMDLDSLARMGHRNVRVIDEQRIQELIARAVSQAIEAESADVAQRQRRLAAEKTRDALHQQLTEHKLEQVQTQDVPGASDGNLGAEIAELQARIADADRIIEEEKRRIAEQSRREFDKLLQNARAELEARAGGYERALRDMIRRSQELVPAEELAALTPVGDEAGGDPTMLISALGERLSAVDRSISARSSQLDEMLGQLRTQEEDIRIAARLRREQEQELARSKAELETVQRQFREQEEDIAIAARQRRGLQAEIDDVKRQLEERERELAEMEREKHDLASELRSAEAERAEHERALEAMLTRMAAAAKPSLEALATSSEAEAEAEAAGEVKQADSSAGAPETDAPGGPVVASESSATARPDEPAGAAEALPSPTAVSSEGEAGPMSAVPAATSQACAALSRETGRECSEPGEPSRGSVVLAQAMGERIKRMTLRLATAGDLLAKSTDERETALAQWREADERAEALEVERNALAAARAEAERRLAEAEAVAEESGRQREAIEAQMAGLQDALAVAGRDLAAAKAGHESTLRDMIGRLEAAERGQSGPIVVVDGEPQRTVAEPEPESESGVPLCEEESAPAARTAGAVLVAQAPVEAPEAQALQAADGEAAAAEGRAPSGASVTLAQAMGARIRRMADQLLAARGALASREAELGEARRRNLELERRAAELGTERDSLASASEEVAKRLAQAESARSEAERRAEGARRRMAALAEELRRHEERTVQRLADLAGQLSATAGDYRERSGALGGMLTGLFGAEGATEASQAH